MIPKRLSDFALTVHGAVEKGVLLIFMSLIALLIANSDSLKAWYIESINDPVIIQYGVHKFDMKLQDFVNDFLVAIFFVLVSMEIKREILTGHLVTAKQRMMPMIAAFGGVIAPAAIYYIINMGDGIALKGIAVPTATDIAFALVLFQIFGKGFSVKLRIFLTALAIIDDLIAIMIIALFYTINLDMEYLIYLVMSVGFLIFLNRAGVFSLLIYVVVGIFMWYCCHRSGIHATISGVLLGFCIPHFHLANSPLSALERNLTTFVSYIVLPLFAFTNSGFDMSNMSLKDTISPVTLGIIAGLFVGKQVGVFSAVYFFDKWKLVRIPKDTTLAQFYAISIFCGIGFTMSLFIGVLSFGDNVQYLVQMKLGVFLGSICSAMAGGIFLQWYRWYRRCWNSK